MYFLQFTEYTIYSIILSLVLSNICYWFEVIRILKWNMIKEEIMKFVFLYFKI